MPLRSLSAFKRVHLNPGETKTIDLVIKADAFTIINDNGKREPFPGKYEITIGGGQPDIKMKTSSNVVSSPVTIL